MTANLLHIRYGMKLSLFMILSISYKFKSSSPLHIPLFWFYRRKRMETMRRFCWLSVALSNHLSHVWIMWKTAADSLHGYVNYPFGTTQSPLVGLWKLFNLNVYKKCNYALCGCYCQFNMRSYNLAFCLSGNSSVYITWQLYILVLL